MNRLVLFVGLARSARPGLGTTGRLSTIRKPAARTLKHDSESKRNRVTTPGREGELDQGGSGRPGFSEIAARQTPITLPTGVTNAEEPGRRN